MTPLLFLALCMTGGVGAAVRLFVDGAIRASTSGRFPTATALINISGSLLLGLVTGLTVSHVVSAGWESVLGTGFLGGYTTFSTASIESFRLLQERRIIAGALNGVGVLLAAVAAAALGYAVGVNL